MPPLKKNEACDIFGSNNMIIIGIARIYCNGNEVEAAQQQRRVSRRGDRQKNVMRDNVLLSVKSLASPWNWREDFSSVLLIFSIAFFDT